MFTLRLANYEANATRQAGQALLGIGFVRFLVPAISAAIVIFCLKIYPVTPKIKEKMRDLYKKGDYK